MGLRNRTHHRNAPVLFVDLVSQPNYATKRSIMLIKYFIGQQEVSPTDLEHTPKVSQGFRSHAYAITR